MLVFTNFYYFIPVAGVLTEEEKIIFRIGSLAMGEIINYTRVIVIVLYDQYSTHRHSGFIILCHVI